MYSEVELDSKCLFELIYTNLIDFSFKKFYAI